WMRSAPERSQPRRRPKWPTVPGVPSEANRNQRKVLFPETISHYSDSFLRTGNHTAAPGARWVNRGRHPWAVDHHKDYSTYPVLQNIQDVFCCVALPCATLSVGKSYFTNLPA